jgi:hypothetical protein
MGSNKGFFFLQIQNVQVSRQFMLTSRKSSSTQSESLQNVSRKKKPLCIPIRDYLLSLLSVLITSSTGGAALMARIAADTCLNTKDGLVFTFYGWMDGCCFLYPYYLQRRNSIILCEINTILPLLPVEAK